MEPLRACAVGVFPHPYFTIPDRDGRFTIAGVPRGRHEAAAWRERAGEVTRVATLDPGSRAELTFSLPLTDPE